MTRSIGAGPGNSKPRSCSSSSPALCSAASATRSGREREAGAAQDDRPDQQLARCAVRRAGNGCLELEVERAVQPARVLGVRAGGMTGAERHDLHPPRAAWAITVSTSARPGTATVCLREHREPTEVRGLRPRASTTRRRRPPRPRHRPRTTRSRRRRAGAGGGSSRARRPSAHRTAPRPTARPRTTRRRRPPSTPAPPNLREFAPASGGHSHAGRLGPDANACQPWVDGRPAST